MPHATATLNGKVIAETDQWAFVENNIYVSASGCGFKAQSLTLVKFPPSTVDQSVLSKATLTSTCSWKGKASYYNIKVDGPSFLLSINVELNSC